MSDVNDSSAARRSPSPSSKRFRGEAAARTRARAVLEELDERYDPGWWAQQWRRKGVMLVTVALGLIVVAGTVAVVRHRNAA